MLFLDFESYSDAPLKKTGLSRYAEDPSTEVHCLAWAVDDAEPELWIAGMPPPHKLFELIRQHQLSAFNAQFEMAIWAEVCVKKMGWPYVPDDKWLDSQADCLALGLPADLDRCAKALGLPEKDPHGKRLITKLCCPVKPTKKHPSTRWTKEEAHEDFLALYVYCKQDVRVERAIAQSLPYRVTSPGHPESPVWQETVRMNKRGIPIDVLTVSRLNDLIEEKLYRLTNMIRGLTEGTIDTVKQAQAIKGYIDERFGIALENMQGDYLITILEQIDGPAADILECFLQASYASIAKFKKMALQLCRDNTIKDNLRFHGAATGRDAGMGVQVQNFPRLSVDDPEFAIECVQDYGIETIEALYGNILELASALIRSVLRAPDGYTFFNADLSSIEARMTAWVAREEDILQAYRDGLDAYKVAAANMFGIKYEDVTKDQRQAGKIAVLACGFQGASAALLSMAANYDITFEKDEAQEIVNQFRAARPKLVKTWAAFGSAAASALNNPGSLIHVETNSKFSFLMKDKFLFMQMPNGKLLAFPFPKYEMWKMPWGKMQMSITHMWINTQAGGKWERRAISGASLMQSAVQGLSGCVLMEANLRLRKHGYDVIFRVHDELTSLVRDDASSNLDHFTRVFTESPTWAVGLPIEADPWAGKRYKK